MSSRYRTILAGILVHDYYIVYLYSGPGTPGVYGPKLSRSKFGSYTMIHGFVDGKEAHTSFSKNISEPAKSGWSDQSVSQLVYAAMYGYDKEGDPHLVMRHGSVSGPAPVPPSQRPKPAPKKDPPKKDPPRPAPNIEPPVVAPAPESPPPALPTPPSGNDGDSGLMTGLIAGGVGLVAAIAVTRKKRHR